LGLPRSSQAEDLKLLRLTAEGSEEAFLRLFQRWSPPLRRFLIRATGSRETGEDLLQEAWIRILKAASRYEPRGTVSAWMYRICANLAYSHWRRERRSPLCSPRQFPDGAGGLGWSDAGGSLRRAFGSGAPDTAPAAAERPDHRRWKRAFAQALEEAVSSLSANHRMAFLLKVDQGLTYEEIASSLGCPEGTVKSRFHHALLRLRSALAEWQEPGGTSGGTGASAGTARGPRARAGKQAGLEERPRPTSERQSRIEASRSGPGERGVRLRRLCPLPQEE